ncbi:DnaJ-class molecular chaperone with C-terminal Zn finger domain [Sanguibacter keddieii DSM 10542]|uniref:DnaJ-class molecular chaperone with C-terminal Zn finger domain n=1 Tax=Sanguibacter keddieii (strain ATCC 51767 / DSM 10542 / NCFB 3025 / ST-74) TaxID=446469 RepID=D1BBM5_SANKS|nr:J domain-containing protein [Sanguibacter keddieii]ACZ22796.1 DnaJ-class molecular chaperone with C-terminal Zn finger domain [Sanguibacter keddieii DSM 10542]
MTDFYSVLGVARDAEPETIAVVYKSLAKRLHPDREGGDATRFAAVTEAYDTLGDERRRADYDRTLSDPTPTEPVVDEDDDWGEEEVSFDDEYGDTFTDVPVVDEEPAELEAGLSIVGLVALGVTGLAAGVLAFLVGGFAWGWLVLNVVLAAVIVRTRGSKIALGGFVLVSLLAYAVRDTDTLGVAAALAAGALPVAAVVANLSRDRSIT